MILSEYKLADGTRTVWYVVMAKFDSSEWPDYDELRDWCSLQFGPSKFNGQNLFGPSKFNGQNPDGFWSYAIDLFCFDKMDDATFFYLTWKGSKYDRL